MAFSWRSLFLPVMIGLAGCTSLPGTAPTTSQVEDSGPARLDIHLFRVNAAVLSIIGRERESGFPSALRGSVYKPSVALRPGDVVAVSIFETGGPSLFGSPVQSQGISGALSETAPKTSTLPAQLIENNGEILVPFVGRVHVAGKTPSQASKQIEKLLEAKALQPQVILSLVANGTNAVTVGGEVNRAGPVPLSLRGERLLDVIAGAGGTKWQTSDSDVRIIRGSVSATIPLQQAVNNQADNIAIRPGDQIVVLRNPKTFTVMGAANKVSQFPLDQEKVTLTEALARAGGAIDTVGDISGIYIFREEPAEVVKRILEVDPTALDRTMGRSDTTVVAARVPVMYRIDLTQAEGYLLAQQLPIRDKDVVLVSNSQGTQLLKMMTIVRGITGVVYDLNRTSNGRW